MHKFRWPEDFSDLIPPGASMILEMAEGYYGSPFRREQFFYLGKTAKQGIAIWLDLMHYPFGQTCFSLSIPLDEVSEIVTRLLNTSIGTGPIHHDIEGSTGIVRVSTCQNHEMSMKWHLIRADSWKAVFTMIDELRNKVLHSPDHVSIPFRKPPKRYGNWNFPD